MDTNSSPTSVRLPQQRTNVFISYSHKDKRWLDQLSIMLRPLVRMGAITIWDDTQIRGGTRWREEIDRALGSARVAVLLVSPDFLASDFITNHELPELLKAAEQEGLTILWVAVRHSMYDVTAIAEYQAANNPARPLSTLPSAKRDEEFKKICEQIKRAAAFDRTFEFPPQKPIILKWPDPSVSLEPANSKSIQSVSPEELVDFEEQQGIFRGMLNHSSEKRLMFVQASGMCGKTSLLRMVRFHCEKKGTPWCLIDFRGQPYDNPHFTLARVMCDQLGLSPRYMTQILAGVNLTHGDLRQRFMKESLNRAFLADLGDFAEERGGIVCLFDSFEDISAEEEDWLLSTLLSPVKRDDLKGVMIVTAGRRWPKIERADWEECAHLIDGLPPMSVENLKMYAQKVNVILTDEQADFCWKASRGGNPLFMGMVVKNLKAVGEVRPRLQSITPEMDEQEALGLILDELLDQPSNGGRDHD
jgi:hypothetical protein